MASSIVKSGSVAIEVKPWRHPSGRDYFRAAYHCPLTHQIRYLTRSTLPAAKEAAYKKAKAISAGTIHLEKLEPHQIRAIQRMLEADPQLALVDEFLVWHGKRAPRKNSTAAVAEFLAIKKSNQGNSTHNVEILTKHLAKLPDADLCDITPADLPELTGAPRTRLNVRRSWVTFFRWCVVREYLPHGERTVAERLETPIVTRGVPTTYTPAQLRIMLTNVRPQYLPWLALAAFAGIRTEEVCPQHGSRKSPLDWSDIHWDRDLIIVRPETSKTRQRRVIPITPALKAWLQPIAGDGRIGPHVHPSKPSTNKAVCETTRLGTFIGGWQRNALRHSFLSYRAAQVGLAQTSMEAGNSESEARASYNDAKGADEATEWFSVLPIVPECS